MITLPKIENDAKLKESFKFVRFCLKYVINPEKEENKITKVEVSTAISIGIKNNNVMIETKNTPPPIPAIVEIIPDRRPKVIKSVIKIEGSIFIKKKNL